MVEVCAPELMKAEHIAPIDAIIRNYLGSDSDLTGQEAVWYLATI